MKTVGEKLDNKLNQDAHDYCQEPEVEKCPTCHGKGEIKEADGWVSPCSTCNGTGQIPKVAFKIEEE